MLEAMLEWLRAKRDPLRGEHSAARWAATVSRRDSADIQRRVVDTLESFPSHYRRLEPEHCDALVRIDERVSATVDQLETDFVAGYESAPETESRLWRAVFELNRVLLAAYLHAVKSAAKGADRRWLRRFPLLLVRLSHYKAVDARLRLYRYAKWSSAQWREMHRIYQLARARRVHRRRLAFDAGGDELPSVEEIYLRTLLEQRMDNGNFTPDQVAWVAERLRRWSAGITLDRSPGEERSFVVDPGGSTGLQRVSDDSPMASVLHVDTAPLVEAIDARLLEIEPGEQAAASAADTGVAPGELPGNEERLVLQRLRALFAPDSQVVQRAEREPAEQPIRVVVGLAAMARTLAGGDTLFSLWRLADRSRTGYRLLAPDTATARIGTLLILEDGGRLRAAVVRRMLRLETDEITYGVEILGNSAVAVRVARLIEGRRGEECDAVYLPADADNRDPLAKALLLSEAIGRPGAVLALVHGEDRYLLRLGHLIEADNGWSLAAVDSAQQA